jgi:hypothetical protein
VLCGRRLWLSVATRDNAKSAKKESPGVSTFGGVGPGLPRPRSPGMPPRISPEAAPLLCTRHPGVIDGRHRVLSELGHSQREIRKEEVGTTTALVCP